MIEGVEVVSIMKWSDINEKNKPRGLFLSRMPRRGRSKGCFVALDNRSGEITTMTFMSLHDAKEWLEERKEIYAKEEENRKTRICRKDDKNYEYTRTKNNGGRR